ncbi:hypothetical protein BC829DRAFT_473789 [Chytridium lagenaria]|nr:hypothetical protein BC829DRAFT_473789 [Chytridium lagenaria]
MKRSASIMSMLLAAMLLSLASTAESWRSRQQSHQPFQRHLLHLHLQLPHKAANLPHNPLQLYLHDQNNDDYHSIPFAHPIPIHHTPHLPSLNRSVVFVGGSPPETPAQLNGIGSMQGRIPISLANAWDASNVTSVAFSATTLANDVYLSPTGRLVYEFFGRLMTTAANATTQIYSYAVASDNLTQLIPQIRSPPPRFGALVVRLDFRHYLIHGGRSYDPVTAAPNSAIGSSNVLGDSWILDVENLEAGLTDGWITPPSVSDRSSSPGSLCFHAGSLGYDGRVYIVGGSSHGLAVWDHNRKQWGGLPASAIVPSGAAMPPLPTRIARNSEKAASQYNTVVIGASVGGAVLIAAMVIFGLIFHVRRKKRLEKAAAEAAEEASRSTNHDVMTERFWKGRGKGEVALEADSLPRQGAASLASGPIPAQPAYYADKTATAGSYLGLDLPSLSLTTSNLGDETATTPVLAANQPRNSAALGTAAPRDTSSDDETDTETGTEDDDDALRPTAEALQVHPLAAPLPAFLPPSHPLPPEPQQLHLHNHPLPPKSPTSSTPGTVPPPQPLSRKRPQQHPVAVSSPSAVSSPKKPLLRPPPSSPQQQHLHHLTVNPSVPKSVAQATAPQLQPTTPHLHGNFQEWVSKAVSPVLCPQVPSHPSPLPSQIHLPGLIPQPPQPPTHPNFYPYYVNGPTTTTKRKSQSSLASSAGRRTSAVDVDTPPELPQQYGYYYYPYAAPYTPQPAPPVAMTARTASQPEMTVEQQEAWKQWWAAQHAAYMQQQMHMQQQGDPQHAYMQQQGNRLLSTVLSLPQWQKDVKRVPSSPALSASDDISSVASSQASPGLTQGVVVPPLRLPPGETVKTSPLKQETVVDEEKV